MPERYYTGRVSRHEKLKKFKAREEKYDPPLTLKYLVEVGWGLADNYYRRLRAGLEKK
jgi:hypothetical protein